MNRYDKHCLVSVIIPIYNSERYLKDCVNSVLRQTYANLEIILINDGSTDKSGFICDKLSMTDNRIRVFHRENNGVSAARNKGMLVSRGMFIMFLDSDDLLREFAIESMRKTATEFDADVVSSGEYRDVDTNSWNEIPNTLADKYQNHISEGSVVLENFFKNKYGQSACARLYKRECVTGVEFDTTIEENEDKLFIYKVFQNANRHVHTPIKVYFYRQRKDSASHSQFSEKFFDREKVADIIYQDVKSRGGDLKNAKTQWTRSLIELYSLMSCSSDIQKEYRNEYSRLRNKIKGIGFSILDTGASTLGFFAIKYVPITLKPLALIRAKLIKSEGLS